MKTCPYCGKPIDFTIGRTTICPACSKELHTCSACRFYSPGAHYDCSEDVDELVADKSRPNFCDSFVLTDRHLETAAGADRRAADKARFDALFNL